MLSGASRPAATRLSFALYHSAGRATFIRFLSGISKCIKNILIRFHQSGLLELVQQPNVTNKIAHIWITSNREVFGFDDYRLDGLTNVVLEFPVKPILAILRASEALDTLQFDFTEYQTGDHQFLKISSGDDMFSFTSTVHDIPVKLIHTGPSDALFREPLISRPAVTFVLPAVGPLTEKIGRLTKHSEAISVAANQQGRFVCSTTSSTTLRAELCLKDVTVINTGEVQQDALVLHEVELEVEALFKVLNCMNLLQTSVMAAVVPKETMILSSKIANPCGPDRPAASITLILAAHDSH